MSSKIFLAYEYSDLLLFIRQRSQRKSCLVSVICWSAQDSERSMISKHIRELW